MGTMDIFIDMTLNCVAVLFAANSDKDFQRQKASLLQVLGNKLENNMNDIKFGRIMEEEFLRAHVYNDDGNEQIEQPIGTSSCTMTINNIRYPLTCQHIFSNQQGVVRNNIPIQVRDTSGQIFQCTRSGGVYSLKYEVELLPAGMIRGTFWPNPVQESGVRPAVDAGVDVAIIRTEPGDTNAYQPVLLDLSEYALSKVQYEPGANHDNYVGWNVQKHGFNGVTKGIIMDANGQWLNYIEDVWRDGRVIVVSGNDVFGVPGDSGALVTSIHNDQKPADNKIAFGLLMKRKRLQMEDEYQGWRVAQHVYYLSNLQYCDTAIRKEVGNILPVGI